MQPRKISFNSLPNNNNAKRQNGNKCFDFIKNNKIIKEYTSHESGGGQPDKNLWTIAASRESNWLSQSLAV